MFVNHIICKALGIRASKDLETKLERRYQKSILDLKIFKPKSEEDIVEKKVDQSQQLIQSLAKVDKK